MSMRILFAAAFAVMSVFIEPTSSAQAGVIYLTGAQLYSAAETGALSFSTDDYRHSTNATDTGASKLFVARGTTIPAVNPVSAGISLQLLTNTDSTTFSFRTSDLNASPGSYVGINLFFGETNSSYNPDNSNIGGHLTVMTTVVSNLQDATGAFTVVPSKTTTNQPVLVQNYAFHSAPNTAKPVANGQTIYQVGGMDLQVSNFSASFSTGNGMQGRFTIRVVATPEPSTLGIGGIACASFVGLLRGRVRRRKS